MGGFPQGVAVLRGELQCCQVDKAELTACIILESKYAEFTIKVSTMGMDLSDSTLETVVKGISLLCLQAARFIEILS